MPSEWTVERHLKVGTEHGCALYERFVAIVAACGPFHTTVAKTTIAFKGDRRGFAGARPQATASWATST